MKKKLVKPTLQSMPYWDYSDVEEYIEAKYKIEFRDYHKYYKGDMSKYMVDDGESETPYLDFWHWYLDNHDVSNGGMGDCYISDFLNEEVEERVPLWVKEILQMIYNEFGEDEMNFYHSW